MLRLCSVHDFHSHLVPLFESQRQIVSHLLCAAAEKPQSAEMKRHSFSSFSARLYPQHSPSGGTNRQHQVDKLDFSARLYPQHSLFGETNQQHQVDKLDFSARLYSQHSPSWETNQQHQVDKLEFFDLTCRSKYFWNLLDILRKSVDILSDLQRLTNWIDCLVNLNLKKRRKF